MRKPLKPGKLFTKDDLRHPLISDTFNGDKIGPLRNRVPSSGERLKDCPRAIRNYVSKKAGVVNGEYRLIDPKTTEVTGRSLQKPPTSLAVGGHERGRHVPLNNAPTHYSPGYQRPGGAPPTAPLTSERKD